MCMKVILREKNSKLDEKGPEGRLEHTQKIHFSPVMFVMHHDREHIVYSDLLGTYVVHFHGLRGNG